MNKYVLTSDIQRALTGRGFLIGIASMIIVITFSSIEDFIEIIRNPLPLENGYHGQLIMTALSSDTITLALPILSALPFTTAFVDDVKSGFIKQFLYRSGRSSYISGKLLACGLSGGMVLFLGILITYGLFMLMFMPMELAIDVTEISQPYFSKIVPKLLLLFFIGAFLSLFGFTLAALTMNKYIAYASPFIFYYLLIILKERYFDSLYVLYPKEWLFPSEVWMFGHYGVIILLSILIAVVSLIFTVVAQRRIAHV
ncbi:hypothetical protein [Bacillus niameyensis]|uniref:hypothetical protein n=1 Tax=Bacillus niameyensis TaxID=1522308 RepID=UPI000784903C|nr:hypothetical protein [Bacillus niameyensis]